MDKLELIPIDKLLNEDFYIPSYQRGYRWKKRQVTDLLEDILEFQKKDKGKGEFYCLQPIVVTKKGNGNWEVIDGQQRLTTLHILLSYLEEAREIMFSSNEKFTISYETREKKEYSSKTFLNNILQIDKIDNRNIDFYRMSKAYLVIKDWFEKNKINKADFLNTLLKTDYQEINNGEIYDFANNIRFIWYKVDTNNEIEAKKIFTRINMGKIPLTNAELIKALFFINNNQSDSQKEKYQSKLAYEWDNIENSLQNHDFWFFINKSNKYQSTKIEFIFDLIADKYEKQVSIDINKNIDNYYTFYIFNFLINNNIKTKNDLWEEIKIYFRTFEEWYNNNEYYHLIGFSIHIGKNVEVIKKISEEKSKSEFKNELHKLISLNIQKKFNKENITKIEELTYQEHYQIISELLLLFNVISSMNSKYTKFPFERYIREKWSLEHIHAQNSENLKTEKQRRLLLEEQKIYFEDLNEKEIINLINEILQGDEINADEFTKLQDDIFKRFTDNDSVYIHTIENMALLTTQDNSALNNNIFPIKRDKIIELDEKGSFIPICTKNVFLKYYSKDVEQNSIWTEKDRKAYKENLIKTLTKYLPKIEETNEN